jgi:hypothetical protein
MLAGTYGFFVLHQFVLGSSSFETYYYTSYLTGPLVIATALLINAVARDRIRRDQIMGIAAVGVIALPIGRNQLVEGFEFHWNPWIPLVFIATAVLILAIRRAPHLAIAAVAMLLFANAALLLGAPRNPPLATNQTFRYDPRYDLAYGNDDWSGFDWYRLTYDLAQITPELEAPDGNVLFWFTDSSNLINGIQSAYLWRASALMSTGQAMPFLDDWRIARLRDQNATWLVLLGTSQEEIDAGVAALQQRNVSVHGRERHVLHRGHDRVYTEVVHITPPPA